ncbi:MAG TPA: hypothetical protein VLW85_12290 [Myxococcales bacterium]|nr:hypothetical protein [Myxococcales bacterium]
MADSQTRFLFWDGVPNVVNGAFDAGSGCKFALSQKDEVYQAKAPPPGAQVVRVKGGAAPASVVVKAPARVRIKEVDESFSPGEQLLSVKLRLRPVQAETSLLVRIYAGQTLIHHEVYGGAEIKRMPTTDPRDRLQNREGKEVVEEKRLPRKNVQREKFTAVKKAPPVGAGTYTVRAWISPRADAFAGSEGKTDAEIEKLPGVVGYKSARPSMTLRERQAEDHRIQAKYGDKVGRNQAVVKVAATYTSAQFIAFHIEPGKKRGARMESLYRGVEDSEKDIDARCAIMKKAIEAAAGHKKIDARPEVLKVFMAPEFFFRGSDGAYPVEELSRVVEVMRAETRKSAYQHWLFVLGSAIGYLPRGEKAAPIEHRINIADVEKFDADKIGPMTELLVGNPKDLGGDAVDPKTGKHAEGRGFESPVICAQVVQEQWKVVQDGVSATVYTVEHDADGYLLELLGSPAFKKGPCKLVEPVATEVFNVCFVQKGGETSDPRLIYKERVSSIDFLGSFEDPDKFADDHRGIIHGKKRLLLPTAGSIDVLGVALSNASGTRTPSDHEIGEINKSGIGGGSVFTQDGITIGVEVCLDHLYKRLRLYYGGKAPKGTPAPQIQLIPSFGMSINAESIACVPGGLLFNVDGRRQGNSAAAVFDGAATKPITSYPEKTKVTDAAMATWFKALQGEIVVYEPKALPPPMIVG